MLSKLHLEELSANYSLEIKNCLPTVLVNKVLLEHTYLHPFISVLPMATFLP